MTAIDIPGAFAPDRPAAPAPAPQWSSNLAFLAAAVGSAVGLGSIWKFPYIVGVNGGGAFVLVYLAFVAAVGIPLMIAELSLGRHGGPSVVRTLAALVPHRRSARAWNAVGWLSAIAAFVILSFYSVVAGWALAYAVKAPLGGLAGLDATASAALFDSLLADPAQMIAWHSAVIAATIAIVARGIQGGIEKATLWLMPLLCALMVALAVYACIVGDAARGFAFMFEPDFAALTPSGVLAAAGHAFFTLSLGMGAMIAYGGYLGNDVSVPRTAAAVAISDTVCSLAAGLAIFPIVFGFGLDPAEGPGLVFVSLPVAFAAMPGGALFGTLFFALLVIAALVSAVSLLEPLVAASTRSEDGRGAATWRLGAAAWALGLVSVLSFNLWSDVRLGAQGMTLFDALNFLTAELALPLAGIATAVFVGWTVAGDRLRGDFASAAGFRLWRLLMRYVAPAVVALVLADVLA